MLTQILPLNTLKTVLIPQTKWHPYPTANEREQWEDLPTRVKKAHLQR